MRHEYEVIVGNIGSVYSGGSSKQALAKFRTYVSQSKSGVGRAGGEDVTVMRDGEPWKEHFGTQENPSVRKSKKRALKLLHQYWPYLSKAAEREERKAINRIFKGRGKTPRALQAALKNPPAGWIPASAVKIVRNKGRIQVRIKRR